MIDDDVVHGEGIGPPATVLPPFERGGLPSGKNDPPRCVHPRPWPPSLRISPTASVSSRKSSSTPPPEGLTVQGLHERTRLAESMLNRVLCLSVERRHVRREGERYFAAHESA